MAKYRAGQCIVLAENEDDEPIFCEIRDYLGSGEYYVSLTRGIVDVAPNKYTSVSRMQESVIDELCLDI